MQQEIGIVDYFNYIFISSYIMVYASNSIYKIAMIFIEKSMTFDPMEGHVVVLNFVGILDTDR